MRKIILSLLFLSVLIEGAAAQSVRVRSGEAGKISVTKGKLLSTIDLSRDTAGCSYVPASARRELNKKECAAAPASFKLVDATTKNNQTYLVVQSEAAGNCNVCGQCGATEAFTLFWLKLDARLRLAEKKAVTMSDCRASVSLLGDTVLFDENTQDETLDLKFKDDILTIEFEETIYDSNSEAANYNFSTLEYNRKTPEKGFVIKTEKRDKSSAKEN